MTVATNKMIEDIAANCARTAHSSAASQIVGDDFSGQARPLKGNVARDATVVFHDGSFIKVTVEIGMSE